MGRLFIVEGADGTGKTTLVDKLVGQGMKLLPPVSRDCNCYDDLFSSFVSMARDNGDWIMDRSIFTDIVYRYVLGGWPTESNISTILKMLSRIDCTIIYCNNKDCYERSMTRGENLVTEESTSLKIRKAYDFLMFIITNYTVIQVVEYDYDDDVSKIALKRVLGGKYGI